MWDEGGEVEGVRWWWRGGRGGEEGRGERRGEKERGLLAWGGQGSTIEECEQTAKEEERKRREAEGGKNKIDTTETKDMEVHRKRRVYVRGGTESRRGWNGDGREGEQERGWNETRMKRLWDWNGTGMEREWNGNGPGMEREWNGNETLMER